MQFIIQITKIFTLFVILTLGDTFFPVNYPNTLGNSRVLAQTVQSRKIEADSLMKQGEQQFAAREFRIAANYFQKALAIYKEIQDQQGIKTAEGYLQAITITLGNFKIPEPPTREQAIEQVNQQIAEKEMLLQKYRNIGDKQKKWETLQDLANLYYTQGSFEGKLSSPQAVKYIEEAAKLAREMGDREKEAESMRLLAVYNGELQKTILKSIQNEVQALQEAQARGTPEQQAEILQRIYSKAVNSITNSPQALDQARAIGNREQQWEILHQLADQEVGSGYTFTIGLESHQTNYPAIKYAEEALNVAQEMGSISKQYRTLDWLLQNSELLNLPDDKTIQYGMKAVQLAFEMKVRSQDFYEIQDDDKVLDILSLLAEKVGISKNRQTIEFVKESIQKFQEPTVQQIPTTPWSPIKISLTQQTKLLAGGLFKIGEIYFSLEDYPQAISYFNKAKTSAGYNSIFAEKLLNDLGISYIKIGNLTEAEKALREAMHSLDFARSTSGFPIDSNFPVRPQLLKETNASAWLQQILLTQNKNEEALEIAEWGRARILGELVAKRLSSQSTPQNLNTRINQIIKEQAQASQDPEFKRQELERLADSPFGRFMLVNMQLKPTLKSPKIEQIKQIAKTENATLIEYSIAPDESLYIWIVTPQGKITFRKADLKSLGTPLKDFVAEVRESIPTGKAQNVKLQRLHKLLIEPIADLLPKNSNERIVFIPQRELFLIPFPALQDTQGKYLIEKHTISTSPAIQFLDLTHKQQQRIEALNNKEILVVGNPGTGKTPLPYAEQEAKNIAQLYKTNPLIGKQATKENVVSKMSSVRIVHLATHGMISDLYALNSSIVLAPSPSDSGLLTAEEILAKKLNAELVVLSACNTGIGQITGDGVIGLSHSFLTSGVPSIIVSLWTVPDDSTSQLMTEFHKNFQKGIGKAQALRQAMLKTKEKYPNPQKWAAFTLIGEAN